MREVPVGSALKPTSSAPARWDPPMTIVCTALVLSLFFLAWRIASVW
jgi:hypothetical protein